MPDSPEDVIRRFNRRRRLQDVWSALLAVWLGACTTIYLWQYHATGRTSTWPYLGLVCAGGVFWLVTWCLFRCPACRKPLYPWQRLNFCPACGARLRKQP